MAYNKDNWHKDGKESLVKDFVDFLNEVAIPVYVDKAEPFRLNSFEDNSHIDEMLIRMWGKEDEFENMIVPDKFHNLWFFHQGLEADFRAIPYAPYQETHDFEYWTEMARELVSDASEVLKDLYVAKYGAEDFDPWAEEEEEEIALDEEEEEEEEEEMNEEQENALFRQWVERLKAEKAMKAMG